MHAFGQKPSLGQQLFGGINRKTWLIHTSLFFVTFVSMTATHWVFFLGMQDSWQFALWYSVPLVIILFAHEMGHYIQARINGVDASLPYFIPMPIITGTMGAVIKMREIPRNNRDLFDIAFWGPAMSFLLSIPCLVFGMMLSEVSDLVPKEGMVIFGDSLLTSFLLEMIFDLSPGQDISGHPLLFAGWFGMLVTCINLMPLGQLDGGHIIYSMLGKRHKHLAQVAFIGLLVVCFFSYQYIVWMLLIFFLIKVEHPDYTRAKIKKRFSEHIQVELPYEQLELGRRRRLLGVVSMVVFLITFVPQPVKVIEKEQPKQMNAMNMKMPLQAAAELSFTLNH